MAVTQAYDLKDFGKLAAEMNGHLTGLSFQKPLKQCRVLWISETKQNFQKGIAPDGTAWAPLKRPRTLPRSRRKAVTARRRRTGESDKPLLDTGLLRASVTGAGTGHVEKLTDSELVIGTNLGYAVFHQGGTRYIPARPFVGVSDPLADKFTTIFADFIVGQLGK